MIDEKQVQEEIAKIIEEEAMTAEQILAKEETELSKPWKQLLAECRKARKEINAEIERELAKYTTEELATVELAPVYLEDSETYTEATEEEINAADALADKILANPGKTPEEKMAEAISESKTLV